MSDELKPHPAALVFQSMNDDRYRELVADIKLNGQLEPITVYDGMILDGRNRYRACLELGIEPVVRNYEGDPWSFSWSLNGARRDVDPIVRGVSFLFCQEGSEKWAKQLAKIKDDGKRKKSEAAKRQPRTIDGRRLASKSQIVAHCEPPPGKKHVAREARADGAKVSPATMGRSEQIFKHRDLAKQLIAGKVKSSEALRQIRKDKKRQAIEQKAVAIAQHAAERPSWSLLNVDVIVGLESVRDEHGPARLIFTDPPYNIGIDYGQGKKADLLPPGEYMAWVRRWLELCRDCLTEDGSLWVMIGDEYAAEYCIELKRLGLTVRSWIKWYETFGVNCANKFNRTSRHIFYTVKNSRNFIFNAEPVTRPSDRQTKYADKRAVDGGKIWDDVWQIPRLTGTCDERIPDFPTQLPLDLVEPIVLCASMPGDLVVDPFSGSGTTGAAALKTGRKYVGIEKNEKFVDLSEMRLKVL